MPKIVNKTTRPLKVHLSQGKVLHLGPRKEGKISVHDVDRKSVQEMVKAGDVDLFDDRGRGAGGEVDDEPLHEQTHGHQHETQPYRRGDR